MTRGMVVTVGWGHGGEHGHGGWVLTNTLYRDFVAQAKAVLHEEVGPCNFFFLHGTNTILVYLYTCILILVLPGMACHACECIQRISHHQSCRFNQTPYDTEHMHSLLFAAARCYSKRALQQADADFPTTRALASRSRLVKK